MTYDNSDTIFQEHLNKLSTYLWCGSTQSVKLFPDTLRRVVGV